MEQQLLRNAMAAIKSTRNRSNVARYAFGFMVIALVGIAAVTRAGAPPAGGLDSRAPFPPYMNGILPSDDVAPMPALLSQTGVFINTASRTPHPGLVPYELNSPLWSDGSAKQRWIGIPFDGTVGSPGSPKIGFSETDFWTFPNGTVIVKNFDLLVNDQTNTVRRLETRILIRYSDNGVQKIRGASYRWRTDNLDADIVNPADGLDVTEDIAVSRANWPAQQTWLYPRPDQCLRCHNDNAGLVLGIKTAQLNRDHSYLQPSGPDRIDSQLRTFNHLGMLDPPIPDAPSYPQFAKMVAIEDTTATLENRARSYIAANCSHCHRPGGQGPTYDMRYDTPILETNIISNGLSGGLIRDDGDDNNHDSRLYIRDSIRVFGAPYFRDPMPPLARNVPDQRVLDVYDQWVNYDYDVMSATRLSPTQVRVQFNRPIEAASATASSNYELDNGAAVTQVTADSDPAAVILTTSTLALSTTYAVTINRVKEAQAPQNPIWPNTMVSFTTPGPTVPNAPVLTGIQAGNGTATLSFLPPSADGGAAITIYTATCTSAQSSTMTGTGTSSPVTVTELANGTEYTCSIRATNSAGEGPVSNALTVTPIAPTPTLVAVLSRKTHVGVGDFDLPLNRTAALNGAVSVEPRGGATQRIVFRFDIPLSSPGSATASSGTVSQVAVGVGAQNNEVVVTLTSISDLQRATISLTNVNGAGTNAAVSLGFLLGDVNGTRTIDATDLAAIKARTGQPVDAGNFWFDLNLSGGVTASEVSAVKARSGRTLS